MYCGDKTAVWIKMPFGTEVGFGSQLPAKGHSPQFSVHVCCGHTAGWIKMPLDMEISLGAGDIVLDRDPVPLQRGTAAPPIFGPCILWPNGWMGQNATWYGGRPRPRPHCVRWGPSSSHEKGHTATPSRFSDAGINRGPCLYIGEVTYICGRNAIAIL